MFDVRLPPEAASMPDPATTRVVEVLKAEGHTLVLAEADARR